MSLFPEERLDSPLGYFICQPGDLLHDGRWKIVRKLGWGPRSSTWVAVESKDPEGWNVLAIKMFTAEATRDQRSMDEAKLLRSLTETASGAFPTLVEYFYEDGRQGKHLCLGIEALRPSVESFRLSNTSGGYLPVHVVKTIVANVRRALCELEKKGIVHCALITENIMFAAMSNLHIYIAKHPGSGVEHVSVDGVSDPVVRSQVLELDINWNCTRSEIADKEIYLNNFGYAHPADEHIDTSKLAPGVLAPPEMLRGEAVGTKSDVWALGVAAYLLLTGTPLFKESSLHHYEETLKNLEQMLISSGKVAVADVPSTLAYLKASLASEPARRSTALGLGDYDWIKEGGACSCGWCG